MKIGISLIGVSTGIRNRDWKKSCHAIKQNIINCWYPRHQPIVFITTYEHGEMSEMLNFYQPQDTIILSSHQDQRQTFIDSLQLLEKSDCDFFITTRFDIDFYYQISTFNFDFNKFNFLFKEGDGYWESDRFTTDNLFGFPRHYIDPLKESVREFYVKPYRDCCPDLHPVYRYITPKIGEENTHFLFDEIHISDSRNRFYKLTREWHPLEIEYFKNMFKE